MLVFIMSEPGSHWRALNREVTRSDLHFRRVTLAAELRTYQHLAQSRGRNEKTDATV